MVPLLFLACQPPVQQDRAEPTYVDDPLAYIEDDDYRRRVLETDLVSVDNTYAQRRLNDLEMWGNLLERDRPTRPFTNADVQAVLDHQPLAPLSGGHEGLVPDALPTTDGEWVALGRRVFFEYPLRAQADIEEVIRSEPGLVGFGFIEQEEAWVGLRVFQDPGQPVQIALTCAQCHGGFDPDGQVSGALSNRELDVGGMRLVTLSDSEDELDATAIEHLAALGPGRTDVLPDGAFNPYAFPDFGGLGQMPYLHHNANWVHRTTSTLALRCETLFITSARERNRIPRVLAYAMARWIHSLPAPPPANEASDLSRRGEEVFHEVGCGECHVPPLYTSDRLVRVEEIGTDPSAGLSVVRFTGNYRIPSLRGVAWTAPYLHHGAFPTLEAMFDPAREEPGHTWGLDRNGEDREALLAFLRTL